MSDLGRRINEAGWTCCEGGHEPGHYDECEDCRKAAKDLEPIVREIVKDERHKVAEEIRERVNIPEDVDSTEWRQGFTIGAIQAARIAERGGE